MKTNYHTHTTWCDGKETPEQMIVKALEKKFDVLGFSSHAMYPFSTAWHICAGQMYSYAEEIRKLAQKYNSHIEILLGFEADYFPLLSSPAHSIYKDIQPHYLIGSVHYIFDEKNVFKKNPWHTGIPYTCFTVDGSEEELAMGIRHVFRGNAKKAVQTYFSLQRDMITSSDFDIIGHIDVIRKRNNSLHFFSEQDSWYKRELEATAKLAAREGKIVEINTGGIARGCIDDSYPSLDFLKILRTYEVPICLNSDAHSAKDLDCAFEASCEKAKAAGYTERLYFTGGSWKACTL